MSHKAFVSLSPVVVMIAAAFLLVPGAPKQEEIQRHRNFGKALWENPITVAQAPDEFKKALDLSGEDRDRMNWGITLMKAGKMPEGVAELLKVQKSSPKLPHTYFNLGILYNRDGDSARAIEQLKTFVALVPNEPVGHHNLGAAYKAAGRMSEAEAEFKQAAALKAVFAAPHFQLYNLYRQSDRKAEAQEQLKLFLAAKKLQEGALGQEDAEWCDFSEVYDPQEGTREPASVKQHYAAPRALNVNVDAATAGIAVLDLAGNGATDAVVWSSQGITLLKAGTDALKSTGLEAVKDVVAVVPADYDNDTLTDLCVITKSAALLYRNNKGHFELAKQIDGTFDNAVWLDYDRDYDVDLLLLGTASKLYRNDGPAGFEDRTADFPFATGRAVRGEVFRMVADTKALDLRVDYADGKSVVYRDQLGAKYIATPGAPIVQAKPELGLETKAYALADFDGDGRVDALAVTKDAKLVYLHNETPRRSYIRVHLTGVKNAKLAPAAEVEIKAGLISTKRMYMGVPLVFDVEDKTDIDMVRITWANGLIQSEKSQPVNKTVHYEEAQRLSGSCPMIWTWNGQEFEFISDVLGVAPLGAAAGDGKFFPVDHTEDIMISGDSLRAVNGIYDVRVTEELAEVSYLDRIRLLAVDHPQSVDIYTNEKFKAPPFTDFQLYGVTERIAPVAAHDSKGRDVRDALLRRDQRYADNFARTRSGAAEPWYVDLDFGNAAADGRALLVLNGWVDWADGSTFLQSSQESKDGLMTPSLEVRDAQGKWQTVIADMGMPSGKPKTIVVDLTGKFLSKSRAVRIRTNLCVYWDQIYLTRNTGAPKMRLTEVPLEGARLHFRGFSRVSIHPERKQPEQFRYANAQPVSNWNPTPGLYTRYGEVGELFQNVDDRFVLMGSGDEAKLRYDARALPTVPAGWRRDFVLSVDGWAKDRDANTAFSQTVLPLPFRTMSGYPYTAQEHYPDDDAHRAYQREWNTRPALELLRPLAKR